jgi:hypothetical protein
MLQTQSCIRFLLTFQHDNYNDWIDIQSKKLTGDQSGYNYYCSNSSYAFFHRIPVGVVVVAVMMSITKSKRNSIIRYTMILIFTTCSSIINIVSILFFFSIHVQFHIFFFSCIPSQH